MRFDIALIAGIIIINISIFLPMAFPVSPHDIWHLFPTPIIGGFVAGFVVRALTRVSKEEFWVDC